MALILLVLLFFLLGLTASDCLTPNLHFISKFLNLSDSLAGLTLVAMGNSSPDILSNYKAMSLGHADLAVSELIGACFFVTSVVIGTISILRPFRLPKTLFTRDSSFLILVIVVIVSALLSGSLTVFTCILLIGCYLVYVGYVVITHSIAKKRILARARDLRIRSAYLPDSHIAVRTEDEDEEEEAYGVEPTLMHLPSIEELNLSNIDDEIYQTELSNEIDQVRFNLADDVDLSGSYGMKQLIHELLHHRKHQAPIQLQIDRGLGITMTDNSAISGERSVDNQYLFSDFLSPEQSFLSKLVDLSEVPTSMLGKIQFFTTFPFRAVINLTTPVAILDDIDIIEPDFFRIACILVFVNMNLWPSALSGGLFVNLPFTLIIVSALVRFKLKIIYAVVGFLSSVMWVSIFATEIINILKTFSIVYQVSDVILGFTAFALGNSIGDFISNFVIAKLGMPLMAFSACFGSPILSLTSMGISGLVIIGASDSSSKSFIQKGAYIINSSRSLVVLALGLINNMMLIFFLSRKFNGYMNEKVGMALIVNWSAISTICVILESI
ncbi:hypothetical protein PSN45_001861 [Yamadazyma tenuis]|nr:hypothetical protein PSN45_001861 [Yamadazyma tenuis]